VADDLHRLRPPPPAADERDRRRGIDLCTCGHERAYHIEDLDEVTPGPCLIFQCKCPRFFPHPQPPR
jgi:hypothetical protein